MAKISRANGIRSRNAILDRSLVLAAAGGLHTATIGALADSLGMSKSGVFAHFGSKDALDLALIDAAAERFARAVMEPAGMAPPGIARLAALSEGLLAFVSQAPIDGSCLTPGHPAFGLDAAPAARARLDAWQERWLQALADSVTEAITRREIAASAETAQMVFELDGVLEAAGRAVRSRRPAEVVDRARKAVDRVLLASLAG